MHISSMPEWLLGPVRLIEPGSEPFPFLLRAQQAENDVGAWLQRHRAEVEVALARHGAVLLRAFDVQTEAAFERAAAALSSILDGRYGDLVKRETAEFVYDATWYPKDRAILFHIEGSHTPALPTRQFFHCARDQFNGGETPIVDCRKLYRALPPQLLAPFERKGLLYI